MSGMRRKFSPSNTTEPGTQIYSLIKYVFIIVEETVNLAPSAHRSDNRSDKWG